MISFTGALKVYLAVEPHDMRKSFNGLAALVSDHLQSDPKGDWGQGRLGTALENQISLEPNKLK